MNVDTRRQRTNEEYSRQTSLNDFGFVPAVQRQLDNLARETDPEQQAQEDNR